MIGEKSKNVVGIKSWISTLLLASIASGAVFLGCATTMPALAADWPKTPEGIAKYRGSDRQQMLEAGAKKEGTLLYYTHNSNKVARDGIIKAFREKYPYVNVQAYSASQSIVEERFRQEGKAGSTSADILESSGVHIAATRNEGMLIPYYSPSVADLSPNAYQSAGDGLVHFATGVVSLGSIAYNSSVISTADVPKTWDDLMKPIFKGKIAITGQSPIPQEWIAAAIQAKGVDWVLGLKGQGVKRLNVSGAGIAQSVASGQSPIGLAVYDSGYRIAKSQGNPIEWVPLEPVQVVSQSLHLVAKAPHPHAAMLWIDWLLSDEGQNAYSEFGFSKTSAKADSPLNRNAVFDRLKTPNYVTDYKFWDEVLTKITE